MTPAVNDGDGGVEYECIVQAGIDDERNGHLMEVSIGADTRNSYALLCPDVSACSP